MSNSARKSRVLIRRVRFRPPAKVRIRMGSVSSVPDGCRSARPSRAGSVCAALLRLVRAGEPGARCQFQLCRPGSRGVEGWTESLLPVRPPGGFGAPRPLGLAAEQRGRAVGAASQPRSGDQLGRLRVATQSVARWALALLQQHSPGGFTPGLDLWASYREHVHDDFDWQTPVHLGAGVNLASSSEIEASYVENEDGGAPLLFFASNRPGGIGAFDIYVSELLADGTWGAATLVPELSSTLPDQAVSVRFDGLEAFIVTGVPPSPAGSTCGCRRVKPCSTRGRRRSIWDRW